MKYILIVWIGLFMISPDRVYGGIFTSKKPKPNPNEQAFELITTLKNDGDARRRAKAAEDLGDLDAQAYPEVIPNLIESMQTDSSGSVRLEAAQALAKLKPATREVADALDYASKNDPSSFVRLRLKTTRLGYRWTEFRSPMKNVAQTPMPPTQLLEVPSVRQPAPAAPVSAKSTIKANAAVVPNLKTLPPEPKRIQSLPLPLPPVDTPDENDPAQEPRRGILSAPK
jgi:hypothetical protein